MNAVVANGKLAQAELKEFAQVAEREKVVRHLVQPACYG